MTKYGKLLLFIVASQPMFLGVMEGVQGGVVMQRVQILPLTLPLRSRMKQEIGNVKIIIK